MIIIAFVNVTFWGSNIPKEVEYYITQVNEKVDISFKNDDQREAYYLGIENTLSILEQLLDEATGKDSIIFYYPKTEIAKEMTANEVIEWISNLTE